MADFIQVQLPSELAPFIDELKEVRAETLEPTSNRQIIVDAVKYYHKARVRK